jgi:hypothetical protein
VRLEAGRCGVAEGDEKKRQRSTGVGKGMKLTDGPHMAVTWEREGVSAEVRNVEENTPFKKYANVAWAERANAGAGLGRMGQNPKKISFWIKLNCWIYQGFENLHKEI